MNPTPCFHEPDVAVAARTGSWPDSLRAHLATCPTCQETAAVAKAMLDLAAETTAPAPPPLSARVLWLRAHYVSQSRRQPGWRAALGSLAQLAPALLAPTVLTLWKSPDYWARLARAVSTVATSATVSPQLASAMILSVVVVTWVMLEDKRMNKRPDATWGGDPDPNKFPGRQGEFGVETQVAGLEILTRVFFRDLLLYDSLVRSADEG